MKRTFATEAGIGSLPRELEKSSGPSGLASRETEAWRILPIPPRPEECYGRTGLVGEMAVQKIRTYESFPAPGLGTIWSRHESGVRKQSQERWNKKVFK